MIEPSTEFQTALRTALINDPAVTALVETDHIRSGSTKPDKLPSIILASPQVIHLGRTSSGAYLTSVAIDLHIWAIEDGADTAQKIGGALAVSLWDTPHSAAVTIVEYTRPSFRFMRDPDPDKAFCHGVGTVECVMQWEI